MEVNKEFQEMKMVLALKRGDETAFRQVFDCRKAQYLQDQKYTFNVLMDMKDPKTNSNPAASGYKVRGIPSKFVIDRTGNIRFSTLGGGTSGEDGFLREMAAMIQLAKSSASLGK